MTSIKGGMIGNYVQAVRDSVATGTTATKLLRKCTKCGHRKKMKGGTTKGGKFFVCAACKG